MSTELQILNTVKTTIQNRSWTGSSNVVFNSNSVVIVPNIEISMPAALSTMITPICLVEPSSGETDPEFDTAPDFIRLNIRIRVIQINPGDTTGEVTLLGGFKTGGSTKSEGRGLLEIEQELYNAIGIMNAKEGIAVQFNKRGDQGAGYINPPEDRRFVSWRDYNFHSWCTVV